MVKGGFERKVGENDDQTYQFLLSDREILQICGAEDVLHHVKGMQVNYLGHITREKKHSTLITLLFNDDQNEKRGRPIKTLECHVLVGESADNFYREALKKRKTDLIGSSCNHSSYAIMKMLFKIFLASFFICFIFMPVQFREV